MKPNIKLILILPSAFFIFLNSFNCFAQEEEKIRALFVEAESYYLFEEFKDALPLYQRILQVDPENYNINFKIGVCYLNDIYQVEKSIAYLEQAVKGISPESKPTSFKERRSPPEALYFLGNAYRSVNRLNEAIEAYEQFKLMLDPLVYDASLVDEQISACKVAVEQERKPMYFLSINMGEGINDRFEELNPVVSGDESVMVFTRRLQFYDAVFCARKLNGKWSTPENLTPYFEVDGNTYSTGLSYDGNELFVYRSDNFDGNLYVSRYRNNKWSKLEKLNGNINTKYWESHASLSKDGRTLYFTSNRSGGYGGLDIYKSERTRTGDWGPAINLGPVINSKYNEDTPFVTEDGKTIYFSSMGHYNMGGYDIFYSTKLDNGQWAKPINVGFPLNTTVDDLFFVPVQEGAYAYYSRYSPDDSYGMTDIYKLEVFTELHPRKFILNGIVRVEGTIEPDYSEYTATLFNYKTGKIIDQSILNRNGTYTLNALSGDFDLQITGKDLEAKTERITIPIGNVSNIISHSTVISSSPSSATAREVAPIADAESAAGPEISINVKEYNVTTNESIPIRLDLERNTDLTIATILNGELMKMEDFEITRRRFVYMLTPDSGVNKLRFTLTDSKGNSTTEEVTVIYTPAFSEENVIVATEKTILADSKRYSGLADLAQGNLEQFLQDIDQQKKQFNTIADLYDYLIENTNEQGYTVDEVDDLVSRYLAQKDLRIFFNELQNNASDSLAETLEKLDPDAHNIFTSESLLNYLDETFATGDDSLNELRDALYRIASINRDPLTLIELLESYSAGDLKTYLGQMKVNRNDFRDTRSIADYLLKALKNNIFPVSELKDAVSKAAMDLDMNFLSQGLIFISSDSLKQTLLILDMKEQQIRNSKDFIIYLMEASDSKGYSKKELLNNIEKLRQDPYYYVDLLRKLMEVKASGALKEFLHEIDVRDLNLNTFESLVDYLLNQSQFHDYNREMVYQLLIDIISPRNVEEFIDLLLRFGDQRIANAIHATDTRQFSKPIEVMQYLLSVSEEYDYTEKDLLRVLLKILLRKGSDVAELSERKGWFAGIDRPALFASLVIVNAVIIALLIMFILRKKRKNE